MIWQIDDACEVRHAGRWKPGVVVSIEANGHPRVKVDDRLMRPGPGKIRRPAAKVTVRERPYVVTLDPPVTFDLPVLEHRPDEPPMDTLVVTKADREAGTVDVVGSRKMAPQPKTTTPRAPSFLAFVRTFPCCVCGRPGPSDAHHYTTGGIGLKGSDYLAVPVCRACHFHNVRDGEKGGATWPGMTREESLLVIWKTSAKLLAMFIDGQRRVKHGG